MGDFDHAAHRAHRKSGSSRHADLTSLAARQIADELADRLLGAGGRTAEPVAVVLAAQERAPVPEALAVQLVHRLRDQDPKITPALTWLDERLALQQHDNRRRRSRSSSPAGLDQCHGTKHHRQFATDLGRRLAAIFERVSLVDAAFAANSHFEDMDFATRTLYRSAVEELARGSKRTELEIADAAVAAATSEQTPASQTETARRGDPRLLFARWRSLRL